MRTYVSETPTVRDLDLYNALRVMKQEMCVYGGDIWNHAAGGVNDVVRIRGNRATIEPRVIKIPHAGDITQRCGHAERAMVSLLAAVNPQCPFVVPRLLRENEKLHYFVLTEVPGDVVSEGQLSGRERYSLGRDVARFALWENSIDASAFQSRVARWHDGLWDWPRRFARLDAFDHDRYPNLGEVIHDLIRLRNRVFGQATPRKQVIHSDLRLPNLTFTGAAGRRQLRGVFDLGSAQLGTLEQEARPLYALGDGAIAGYNDGLVANSRPPVDSEHVRFWYLGRRILGLLEELDAGATAARAYEADRRAITVAYPDRDWSELPPPTFGEYSGGEAGPGLGWGMFA